jgi:TctA family transporter
MGTVAGASTMKGLLAGGIGLMLAAIGVDPQTGSLRYTFGWTYLWDRLDVVPVVVGLLAVPEIVVLAIRGTSIAEARSLRLSGVMAGVKDTFRHFGLVARSSLIGVYFGILPALGASVAQWIAYGHAVQGLKDRARAGRGAVEGILAPGAANNATRGGDLVPTLAFGIPGSASMALVLSALLVGGLTPGPEMLGARLDVTFAMVWVLILANALGAAAAFLVLRWLAALTFVRGSLLIPFLLLFVFVGAFTANHSLNDVLVTLVFGAVGYGMLIGGWPRPPLILGVVLGRIAESYLWVSTAAYGSRWLVFPSVTLLLVVYRGFSARRARAAAATGVRRSAGWVS